MTSATDSTPTPATSTRTSRWLRRLIRLSTALVLLGLASGIAVCCVIGDFTSDFAGDAQVERLSIPITIDREPYELSVLRSGNPSGRQVVFVHGTPGDAGNFLRLLRAVPDDFEFWSLDRPGFGETTPTHALTSLDAQAQAVGALLETRNGRAPILVGHSLGGPIIAAVAANYPDRVGGMVQVAGSLDPELEETLLIQYLGAAPPFVWLIPRALRNCNSEIFALEEQLEALRDELDRVTAPTVILHGTADSLVPYANVPYMQQHLTRARPLELVTIEGGNHFLPWNAEPLILTAIQRIADDFPGGVQAERTVTKAAAAGDGASGSEVPSDEDG